MSKPVITVHTMPGFPTLHKLSVHGAARLGLLSGGFKYPPLIELRTDVRATGPFDEGGPQPFDAEAEAEAIMELFKAGLPSATYEKLAKLLHEDVHGAREEG